jgi:hypothetical protein
LTYSHSQEHTSIIRPTTHPEGSSEPSKTKKIAAKQHETRTSENYEEGRIANEQSAPSRPDSLLAALGCAAHDPAGVPEALRRCRRWMGTRFEPRRGHPGKLDKPPYRVVEGQPIIKADKTDPANWASYEEALAALHAGEVDAIGYVFTEGDPFWVADCDGVVDPDTGEVIPTAADFIHALDSYAELSCSGKGVHVIAQGVKAATRCKSEALGFELEVYDRKRFLVITGNRISATAEVADRQRELDDLCRKLWPTSGATRPRNGRGGTGKGSATYISKEAYHASVADDVLLERARRAGTGPKFCALYDQGDTSRYRSASEADYGLLNMLIFWTAGDPEQIARLFRGSALYRTEGKDPGYVELSVSNALASYVGGFYRPRDVERVQQEEEDDPLAPYVELLLDLPQWCGRKAASAYKAYAGAVMLAAEDGIVDDQGNLRIGCDLRRLAEAAGTRRQTLGDSALPHLMKMGLLRWRPGKGTKAGVLMLPQPGGSASRTNKETTHFSGTSYAPPETALETLRLLIRMRPGHSKHAKLLRLGMPAMFVTVALVFGVVRRGQKITELAERTGRRVRDLRKVLARLKGAGIAREVAKDTYRLTDDYAAQYLRVLDQSGIIYTEREQRRRHADDRKRRAEDLGTDKQDKALYGKERNRRNLAKRREEDVQRQTEEQRRKVGTTAAVFLADELAGVTAVAFKEARQRWVEQGDKGEDLQRAVQKGGPYRLYRESDGTLCITHADAKRPAPAPEGKKRTRAPDPGAQRPTYEQQQRIQRLIHEGMNPEFARAEVLGEGIP